MIFQTEEVRDKFHRLDTKMQHSWARAELTLAQHGQMIKVCSVQGSQVLIEISDCLVSPVPVQSQLLTGD